MNRYLYLFTLIVICSILCCGCSHQQKDGKLSLKINRVKTDVWLNLMPGGPGSFHVAGEISVKNKENYNLNNLRIVSITVTQHDKNLYSFEPVFIPKNENENGVLAENTEKDFLFYTQSGLSINKELKVDVPINIKMLFREDENSFIYDIENIKVEKVY